MNTRTMKRKILVLILSLVVIVSAIVLLCHFIVVRNASGKIYSDVEEIPSAHVGLLLGTPPQARYGMGTNLFFTYRIDAAEQLYKEGKISSIFISGDDNSLNGASETECMRDTLVARGIPEEDIYLDGKGLSTYETVVRANKAFGIKEFTVISQQFHNERAIYLAEHLNLDINEVQAFNAKSPMKNLSILTYLREYLARVKMFIDVLSHDEKNEPAMEKDIYSIIVKKENYEFFHDINTIVAHNEQDTVVGNFTGRGIDTLYVNTVVWDEKDIYDGTQFFVKSSNHQIPTIELFGFAIVPPRLVYEGDLDGNGTDEFGYLCTWMNSQWRSYNIFTLVNNEWRYLVHGEYLCNGELFRSSGIEVAEAGSKKGTVLIHYFCDEYDEVNDEQIWEFRDTLVIPTFTKIED